MCGYVIVSGCFHFWTVLDFIDQLQAGAAQFDTNAHRLKRKMWWQNCKVMKQALCQALGSGCCNLFTFNFCLIVDVDYSNCGSCCYNCRHCQ